MEYVLVSGTCPWYTSLMRNVPGRRKPMKISIPGYRELNISNLILDYNGTIAVDGAIPDEVKAALTRLSELLSIYVLTADTHGTAKAMCRDFHSPLPGSVLLCRHRKRPQ